MEPFFDFTKARKTLHAIAEVSNLEFETAKQVREFLDVIGGYTEVITLDQTGFAAVYSGLKPGNRIVLRCELDALPIHEVNGFSHRSVTDGVSHKCGHDGHMSILLEVAEFLANNRIESGEVALLFQSAEETGDGAVAALNSVNFSRIEPDFIYSLHNIPGVAKGKVLLREGNFTPSVKSLILTFHGKTAHAAEPEKGLNPDAALAETIALVHSQTRNTPKSDDFFLITTVHVNLGEKAYGISAGYAELHLTLRAWDEQLLNKECQSFLDQSVAIASRHRLHVTHEWCFEFQANVNHPEAVSNIVEAAEIADLTVERMSEPFKFGEDFGIFTQQYKGAMFGLGAGESTPALHNPDYDFPDDIRPAGARVFIELLKKHFAFV
jgi:amidohydrolase